MFTPDWVFSILVVLFYYNMTRNQTIPIQELDKTVFSSFGLLSQLDLFHLLYCFAKDVFVLSVVFNMSILIRKGCIYDTDYYHQRNVLKSIRCFVEITLTIRLKYMYIFLIKLSVSVKQGVEFTYTERLSLNLLPYCQSSKYWSEIPFFQTALFKNDFSPVFPSRISHSKSRDNYT